MEHRITFVLEASPQVLARLDQVLRHEAHKYESFFAIAGQALQTLVLSLARGHQCGTGEEEDPFGTVGTTDPS